MISDSYQLWNWNLYFASMLIVPDSRHKKMLKLSFVLLALTIFLGAFGSHGLKKQISDSLLETYQTGVQYGFIHALGVSILVLSSVFSGRNLMPSIYFMLGGMLLFSGSLMLYALHELPGFSILIHLRKSAPVGGLLLMVAWISAAWRFTIK